MELWDLYTRDRKLTGKTHIRGVEVPQGYYHLVVHIWIRNREGKYLISQRAADREMYPLQWECVGGSILAGENSINGALREVYEEVGIELNEENGRVVYSVVGRRIDGREIRDILDVWLFEQDVQPDLSRASTREVEQVRWMTRDEIWDLYKEGKLVYTLGYFFEKIDHKI